MSDSMPHRSDLRIEAVGPQTRPHPDGTVHRHVLVAVRGVMALTLDDAAHLAAQLLQAVRQAEGA